MTKIPYKLKHDSIVDAVAEIRFDCAESREAPEISIGMLATGARWKGYDRRRLAEADIPEVLRQADPSLANRPSIELRNLASNHIVRVGSRVVSTHRPGKYPGWAAMYDDIDRLVSTVFDTLNNVEVSRLGLRYTNVLQEAEHEIKHIHDLDFTVSVARKELGSDINLNYLKTNDDVETVVRIASKKFVKNLHPVEAAGVVDLDTSCISPEGKAGPEQVLAWFVKAHAFEKQTFFELFPADVLDRIVEEWE